ncbi:hypothetical protein [Micromonospora sp. LOL_023]|uniref:hypothetical protein n=1 Tax=Micromonospora sp. LOL_023 TaxID=3345418 RepID=UPI003A846CB2
MIALRRYRLLSMIFAAVVALGVTLVWLAPVADAGELCGRADTINIAGERQVVMNNVWGADTLQCLEVDPADVGGRWNATYDLWFHTDANARRTPDGAELMVWLARPTNQVDDFELAVFTRDAVGRGYLDRDWYLSGVEAGFEIWHGGAGLASRSFEVAINL